MITRESIIASVSAYVIETYGDGTLASYKKEFNLLDADHDGSIGKAELMLLFTKAKVGSGFGVRIERAVAAGKTLLALDTDNSDSIEWTEFAVAFTGPKA